MLCEPREMIRETFPSASESSHTKRHSHTNTSQSDSTSQITVAHFKAVYSCRIHEFKSQLWLFCTKANSALWPFPVG